MLVKFDHLTYAANRNNVTRIIEELMNSEGHGMAYPQNGSESVGPGTQMRNRTEILPRMALGLDRVILGAVAEQSYL